jgi:hypothetical protein
MINRPTNLIRKQQALAFFNSPQALKVVQCVTFQHETGKLHRILEANR